MNSRKEEKKRKEKQKKQMGIDSYKNQTNNAIPSPPQPSHHQICI